MKSHALRVFTLAALSAAAAAGQAPERMALREAMETAARLNPDIAAARLRALESQANQETAQSAYRPQLQIAAGSAYQTNNLAGIGVMFPGVPSRIGPFRTFNARPVLSQTVLDLSLLASIRGGRFGVERQHHEAEAARERIQLAVLQLYLQALQADSRFAAAEARLGTAEALLHRARNFEQTGAGSKLDVARAEQRYQEERSATITARRDSRTLRILLLETIGFDPAPELELEPLTVLPDAAPMERNGMIGEAYLVRPELRALQAAELAARQEEKRAAAGRLPKIGFQADFGLLGEGPDRSVSTYAVAGTMTIPVWTSGRIAAERKAARARREQVEASTRRMRLEVRREMEQAIVEREAARESLVAAQAARAAARESLELARLRYEAGLAASLDIVTAQGILAEAEDFEIRTRYEYLLATARLARARGDVNGFFGML